MSELGMIGYGAWKTTPPDYYERDDSPRCCEPGCTDEAEYDGRCEFHFSEWQEEQRLDSEPGIEWGNLEL
jgi:hypothetical protein